MRRTPSFIYTILLVMSACVLTASAQSWTVLHTFTNGKDGASPSSGVISDAQGNLYGVTFKGGTYNSGTAYRLSVSNKKWKSTILHSFAGGTDGIDPVGNLVVDDAGALYGVTQFGGTHNQGTVFQLALTDGKWKNKVLYNFGASNIDGASPAAGLISDAAGNLYGTTSAGGRYGMGTVIELQPQKTGKWKESILYSFGSSSTDAEVPVAALVMDKRGNLYGTTTYGGTGAGCVSGFNDTCGTVFELTKSKSGWAETVLYSFQNFDDSEHPLDSLILDKNGNLYGTSYGNVQADWGNVFELVHSGGTWTFNQIYYFDCFDGSCPDGSNPSAGLAWDSHGNLYGATTTGGTYGAGVIFEFTPSGKTWNFNNLVTLGTRFKDGAEPAATMLVTKKGTLIGTTPYGGDPQCKCGVVFEITR